MVTRVILFLIVLVGCVPRAALADEPERASERGAILYRAAVRDADRGSWALAASLYSLAGSHVREGTIGSLSSQDASSVGPLYPHLGRGFALMKLAAQELELSRAAGGERNRNGRDPQTAYQSRMKVVVTELGRSLAECPTLLGAWLLAKTYVEQGDLKAARLLLSEGTFRVPVTVWPNGTMPKGLERTAPFAFDHTVKFSVVPGGGRIDGQLPRRLAAFDFSRTVTNIVEDDPNSPAVQKYQRNLAETEAPQAILGKTKSSFSPVKSALIEIAISIPAEARGPED